MKKPMTGDRFANAVLMFAAWNVALTFANMVLVIVYDWPVVICGSVSGLLFMLVCIKFTAWIYTETTLEAFRKLQDEQSRGRMLPRGQEPEDGV
jgi:hypothetical protein